MGKSFKCLYCRTYPKEEQRLKLWLARTDPALLPAASWSSIMSVSAQLEGAQVAG